jgi:hypothetical protein
MMSISIDQEADVASVDLLPGRPISRSVRVGSSLLANYSQGDSLVSVEILSLSALLRPDVAEELRALLGPSAALRTTPSGAGGTHHIVRRSSTDLVDLLAERPAGHVATGGHEPLVVRGF